MEVLFTTPIKKATIAMLLSMLPA